MEKKEENKWVYSLDGENFDSDYFNSKAECLDYCYKNELKDGNEKVWIGQCQPHTITDFVDYEATVEQARCMAEDNCGEPAEDYLSELDGNSEDMMYARAEFNKFIEDWATKYGLQPGFYSVINVTEEPLI